VEEGAVAAALAVRSRACEGLGGTAGQGESGMRICVYGAGSIGGYLAARLAKAGREVAVIARGAHLEAIQSNGLTLETPDERFTVQIQASDDPAAIGPVDIVLVTAKTTANAEVAQRIAPLLKPETPVVFTQNGVFWWYGHGFQPTGRPLDLARLDRDGALARRIGAERALGMVIYSPDEVVAPGVVRNARSTNRFVLGDPSAPAGERESKVARALDGAGFTVEQAKDIRLEMWRKLAINLSGGTIAALTGARTDQVMADAPVRAIARRMMEGGIAVAAAHGFTDLGLDPEAATAPGSRPQHKPSMLQDLERGRPMEIDSMIGVVADLARDAGVPTPTLDVVLALLALRARTAGCYGG
jgi:2-dehydropantoate 2-reductase